MCVVCTRVFFAKIVSNTSAEFDQLSSRCTTIRNVCFHVRAMLARLPRTGNWGREQEHCCMLVIGRS